MAQRVQIILEDDLDGSSATETIRFGLDGVDYEIDLSEDNAAKLRDGLAPWVAHGRRLGGRKRSSGKPASTSTASKAGDVRAWAQAQGLEVSARGRIPAEIQEAYDKAH
ncbi:Lsr2 family protein [Naumannella halotolerans]|uniref:histone-like nucleoid-structuring protein Lsr2 n=1 Tax=Naumannella halotolerans TaxID=993414 RepID=UPI00370D0552